MNSKKIIKVIRNGESETIEFKETFGKEAIETICAFANSKGGTIFIGIDDNGRQNGIQIGKSTLSDWQNQIAQGTGGITPSINTYNIKGKQIVSVRIPPSSIRPVMYNGRAFKRSGSTTRQMNLEEITRLVLTTNRTSWDEVVEERANMSDISITKFKIYEKMANEKRRRPIPAGTPPLEALKRLELIQNEKPTRAAILLFGKNPQKFYSHALVKAGRFRNESLIVDDREIEGTLFDQVEGIMNYFRERLETKFIITGKPERDVIWEYPLNALREAVINAVCHRDYLSFAHTQVRIYDNNVLIMNSGRLPEGLSIKDLKKPHNSIPRNKQIAKIFFYSGLIEHWGQGIGNMIHDCVNSGLPEPIFEEDYFFKVTFQKSPSKLTPQVPDKYRTSTGQVPDKHALLKFCTTPKSIKEMMNFMQLKHRENFMENYLYQLLDDKFLAMTNPKSPRSPKQKYIAPNKELKIE